MRAVLSAARVLFPILAFLVSGLAWAAGEMASVVSLTGTVSARGKDGSMRVLAPASVLRPGDVVQTEKDSGVNLKFSDGGKVALRANSRFEIESYRFDLPKAEEDNASFRLLKGGMRTLTGLIGKRGNQDSYQNKTPTATVGIRGTDYALLLCASADTGCRDLVTPASFKGSDGWVPEGLYLSVFEGRINVANRAGGMDFSAGTTGYVRDFDTLPRELEMEEGMAREYLGFHGLFNLLTPLDANPQACLVR